MVDKNISISNLIYFMKTMLSEVFQKDIKAVSYTHLKHLQLNGRKNQVLQDTKFSILLTVNLKRETNQ